MIFADNTNYSCDQKKFNGGVTVSVVSHGQEALLNGFLDDLSQHASKLVRRVVVTHNLPSKGISCINWEMNDILNQTYNKAPKGFGENHNAAFSFCDTEWFAVINPDIRFEGDVFRLLISRSLPSDVVLGPALFDPDCGEVAANRGLLTVFEIVRKNLFKNKLNEDIVWLPGAFLLVRAEAFRRIGGFDERFYLYAEDFDLSARLRLAGGHLRFVSDVHVIHAAQRTSHLRLRYLRWHVMSLMRLWTSPSFWRYRALLQNEARRAAQRLR